MALNILNKYVGGILGLALLAFVVLNAPARRVLWSPKAWLGGLICALCLFPHAWWLYQTDFESLSYISERTGAGKIKSAVRYLFYPVKFLAAQVLFVLPAGLTYTLFARRLPKQTANIGRDEKVFLLCLGIVPTLFWVGSSLLSGTPLKDMWNTPGLFALGLIAFTFIPRAWSEAPARRFLNVMFGWSLLFALAYAGQCLFSTSLRFQSDCSAIVKQLMTQYRNETQKQPAYVGGTIWFSDMVTLYADTEVAPMIWMRPRSNPWLSRSDFEQKGALVVAENAGEYARFQEQYPAISKPRQLDVVYHNYFGQTKTKPLYWGIYTGESDEK